MSNPVDRYGTPAPTPKVGLPASYIIGSDQYGGVLISVSPTRHRVTWQHLHDIGGLGILGAREFTRRADGHYRPLGNTCGSLLLGVNKTKAEFNPSF